MAILREYLQYLSPLGWEAISYEGKLLVWHPVMLSVEIPLWFVVLERAVIVLTHSTQLSLLTIHLVKQITRKSAFWFHLVLQ